MTLISPFPLQMLGCWSAESLCTRGCLWHHREPAGSAGSLLALRKPGESPPWRGAHLLALQLPTGAAERGGRALGASRRGVLTRCLALPPVKGGFCAGRAVPWKSQVRLATAALHSPSSQSALLFRKGAMLGDGSGSSHCIYCRWGFA